MLFLATWGFAQGQLLSTQYFGEDKGLNITVLNSFFHDREGFLWLATREGLVRFDGLSFRYFRNIPGDSSSIYSNFVYCITEDAVGDIWVGLIRGGVSRYDRKTGRFRNYPFTEKLKIKTASVISIYFDRADEVWLGLANYGLVHLDKKTGNFKSYDLVTAQSAPHLTPIERPNYNAAQNIWQDETGLLWCATTDDLYSFDPKTGVATPHRFEKKAADGFRQNQAFCMFPEGDFLWVGGWGSALRRFNRKTGEWKQFLLDENPAQADGANVVNRILPKNGDELWVSSDDFGLCIFNKKTGKYTVLNQDSTNYPGFPTGGMSGLTIDNQGNFWLSHLGRILRIQFKNRQFRLHPVLPMGVCAKEKPLPSKVLDDREGRFRFIALYTCDGLQVVDKKTGKITAPTFREVPKVTEGSRMVVDILQAFDGTIWVLGRHLLYRFNPQTLQLEVPPQPPVYDPVDGSNYYTQMADDGLGNIWLSSGMYGVSRYNTRTGLTTHFMPDEKQPGAIATNVVGSLKADGKGRVWYGSRDKTAYGYCPPDGDRFVYLDAQGGVTTALASLRMNSFFTDKKGDIWACTEQGLLHFDCSGEQPSLVRKYTVADGLTSDYVPFGAEDSQGDIWVNPPNHLCRLDLSTGQITSFSKQDGLPNSAAVGSFPDGEVYLTWENGYYTFHPDSLKSYQSKSPIILTSFRVNDREQYFGSELMLTQPLVVPADGRYFSLEFAALDLSYPELSRYEYQMEGLDNQWVKAGNRHFVNYTNVPAGQYFFKVKLEGMPDSAALSIPLTVRVAFYKKTWFWLTLGILGLTGAGWLYARRQAHERQVRALQGKTQLLEKEKALVQYESLKQQLNPHFLFNSLTSLGSLISIDPKGAATFLDSLSKTYRYILKSSERETVPLVEELKFGETFVKLQKTRFGEGLQVNFKVSEADFHRKIVPVTLQNLIENAIKHNIIDEDEPLVVDVTVEDGYVVVCNNLQRKKFVETSNKRGLANLQSFYRYLSDKAILVEEDEQFFKIKVPLI